MIKLPEPVDHQVLILGNRWTHCTPILFEKSSERSIVRALFTEAQLLQAVRDALKQAAQICVDLAITDCSDSNSTRRECADEIRALINEIPV